MSWACGSSLPTCLSSNRFTWTIPPPWHTGQSRMQTIFSMSHSYMSHARLDICPLHPPNLPWPAVLPQHSFHFGPCQIMPPDSQTAQTDRRLQRSPAPLEVYFRSIPTCGPSRTNQPRTIQGWRRLPLRRPTRFRGQLRTVDYSRSSCGPGQVTSLPEL